MFLSTLNKTKRFEVWEVQSRNHNPSLRNRNKISIGNRKISIQDIVKVAGSSSLVVIDNSSLEKIIQEVRDDLDQSEIVNYSPSFSQPSTSTNYYPEDICRAMLFAKVVTLLQGKSSVRATFIDFLVNLLNSGVIPCFIDGFNFGEQLISIICGNRGHAYFNNQIVESSIAFSNSGISPIPLSKSEVDSILYGQEVASAVGASSLLVGYAANSFLTIDIISSYSCEAIGVPIESFDAVRFEICRPHRGQITSASNLRLLLEGSKCLVAHQTTAVPSLTNIPQKHGPAQEALTAAVRMLELELNSSEHAPITSHTQALSSTQSFVALGIAYNALNTVLSSCLERLKDFPAESVSSIPETKALMISSPPSWQDLLEVHQTVKRLTYCLAQELVTANKILNDKDSSSGVNSKAPPPTSTEETKASTSGQPAISKKPGKESQVDDASLTPEQRAKVEAKRREKALKAELKAKNKEAKKSAVGALVLGVGSTLLRSHIAKLFGSEATLEAIQKALDPADVSEDSFPSFCAKLLEQLSSGGKHKPKIPKGTRDFTPEQMRIREQVFSVIRQVFKRHGAVEIDTPVFELREILMGKYGEDSKLIYDLADQGGELLSLRYDLTVPFARFLAMNSVGNIKRFHIAKVYRRDNPQLSRGRYREFYQCDFDIAGSYTVMVPDAEVITVATEILSSLPLGPFMVKLNHRGILDAVFEICGVPNDKFRTICSAVDKLDKSPWEEVKREMVEDKGLSPEVADRIGEFVLNHGEPHELWEKLKAENRFGDHKVANGALSDLKVLFDYLESMGSLKYVHFDLSLARGLDYYTGVIYEVVLVDQGNSGISVGSIAAGGRYDNLVGMFSTSGQQTPCVGVSIGIERVFAIMERKAAELGLLQASNIDVFVASIGAGLVRHRMKVARLLWDSNISAEFPHQDNPKFKKQLDDVLERGIPYMVVFGEEEMSKGTVKVKSIREHEELEVPLEEMVSTLISKGCSRISTGIKIDF